MDLSLNHTNIFFSKQIIQTIPIFSENTRAKHKIVEKGILY